MIGINFFIVVIIFIIEVLWILNKIKKWSVYNKSDVLMIDVILFFFLKIGKK